ncbi:hypothetical protein A3SI_18507 [Nitritalea halalkaliphila LW7]|uniref:Chromosome segregation protein SMC n=1 Tax=Nitritalea halalkaliphila LW7 TaxID=1189621 RepID=I5BU43_9BACT|nr:hypothetical protein [Nitritalea halalkaliphila]EIM73095.1 hypothetical protein A3SI_18507 [Nitritalea halalkaliphila LW7]
MQTNPTPPPARSDRNKNILIIALAILVLISGIKLFLDHQDKNKKTQEILVLSEENNEINQRLDSVTYQLDLRIQEIERLGGDVAALEEIRTQLINERNSEKRRSAQEIERLNQRLKSYIALLDEKDDEIIALRNENQQLFAENQDLKTNQARIEERVVELDQRREELEKKVDLAARLKAENIEIAAVNRRGRERTDGFRNRQLETLKISFTLADNPVAPHGPRDIFIQILAPNSQPIFDIAKGSGTFMIDGREEFYTMSQAIMFDNTQQALENFYDKETKYDTGEHTVRIYADGYLIGTGKFEVK